MPNVQIIVEGDISDVSASLDQVNQKAAQLSSGFAQAGNASDQATSRMTSGFNNTRVVTDLMTGNISRAEQALVRLGARTELLGPLISAAFAPAAIIAFVEIVSSLPKGIDSIIEKMTGWKAASDAMDASQGALNKSLAEMNKQLEDAQRKGAVIGMGSLGAAQTNLGFAKSDITTQQQAIDDLKTKMANIKNATKTVSGGLFGTMGEAMGGEVTPTTVPKYSPEDLTTNKEFQDLTAQLEEAQQKLALLKQEASNAGAEVDNAFNKEGKQALDGFLQDIEKTRGEWDKWIQSGEQFNSAFISDIHKTAAEYKQFEDQQSQQEKSIAEARANGMKEIDAQFAANIESDHRIVTEGQKAAEQYARAWTSARDRMANQLDSFFNELTSGNIGQAFLKQFEKLVSQMVATWLMGIQGMGSAVSRSGGLFGTLFGLGGGGGASPAIGALDGSVFSGSQGGGIFNFSGSGGGFTAGEASMLGLPLSAGGGAGSLALSTLPAGASNVGALGGSGLFGGLLKGLGSLLPIGALGSGALGYGAGAVAGPLLTGLSESLFLSGGIGAGLATTLATVGSFLGPIGAGIGLVAGLIGLFTGKGKLKKDQTAVLQDMENQLNLLQNAYDVHQVDYNSAIAQAEQIRQSYTQQQEQLQKGGSVGRVDPWVDALENHINQVEQQRQNTLAASANFGPAQFSAGGFVHPSLARMAPSGFAPAMHFAMGGAVPAIVHAGEYVLNAAAVNRLGVGNLDSWNSGRGGPAIHMENHFHALDAKSFEGWMSSGDGSKAFNRSIRRALSEGRM